MHPARESLEVLQQIRANIGEYHFAGQYQQSPVPQGGSIIKLHWLKKMSSFQWPTAFDQIIQSWDTASKVTDMSDFSVCTTWGIKGKVAYLLDVYRGRLDFPALRQKAIDLYHVYKPHRILVEDKSSGIQLIQELKNIGFYHVQAVKPQRDKAMRLFMQAAFIEGGGMLLPENAPWVEDYILELTSFPTGKYDDQVDSTTQALGWLQESMNKDWILTYMENDIEKRMARGSCRRIIWISSR